MLKDKFGRVVDYLRIAVTDKCNLRCHYCMPSSGIIYETNSELLSYEEIIHIVKILSKQGISKLRITGGEPFLRKDLMSLIRSLSQIEGIKKIAITTNGTLTVDHLDELMALGISTINLSLDSLDKERFKTISRTDQFDKVWNCFQEILKRDFELKLNCVVLEDHNIADIIPMVELGRKLPISVRFIEEMPFNGSGKSTKSLNWNHFRILDHIEKHFGDIDQMRSEYGSTSINYSVNGFIGSFGIIPAFSRSFCGSCNRIRLTPNGTIKTCLYDEGVFNLRDLIRAGANEEQILLAITDAITNKAKNGFEAEKNRSENKFIIESMAQIGG